MAMSRARRAPSRRPAPPATGDPVTSKPSGQSPERRDLGHDRQLGQERVHHLGIAALPQRAIEAAARFGKTDGIHLRRRQALDHELGGCPRRRRRPDRRARPLGRPARRGRAVPIGRELGCGRRWRLRLGKQPDRTLLRQARARRNHDHRSGHRGPHAEPQRRAQEGQSEHAQISVGTVSSGTTRSTRAVGGGISQVTRNTVPPSTMTRSSTKRRRLIVAIGFQRCPSCLWRRTCLAPRSPLYIPLRGELSTSGQATGRIIA